MWQQDGRIAEAKNSPRDARNMGAIATPQHQARANSLDRRRVRSLASACACDPLKLCERVAEALQLPPWRVHRGGCFSLPRCARLDAAFNPFSIILESAPRMRPMNRVSPGIGMSSPTDSGGSSHLRKFRTSMPKNCCRRTSSISCVCKISLAQWSICVPGNGKRSLS